MPLTEVQQQSAETDANPMMYPEMDSDGQASTQFTATGPKPGPSGEFNDAPAKSPSDQAYEDADPDPHAAAKKYNNAHPEHVSKFNELTNDSCMVEGQLDIGMVVAFQAKHGLSADGMVGPHTIGAAHHAKKTVGTPSAEGSAMAMKLFEEVNGPPAQAAPAAAAAPKTVGAPSAEGSAMAMKLFEEVNGGPGQAAPTTPSGGPVSQTETDVDADGNQRRRS
ncbi:MAG TPA: hypothetical protein VH143_20490 [Kofleriaceae bacterium]|jgi:hypothetical protein|nr:hypothetical protein [Kofleriaceae bacterium]